MGLLQTLGTGQGYLKAGFLGFPKSGKTWTATDLALGTRKHFNLQGPLAFYDTEGGVEFVAPRVKKATGLDPVGLKSRSLEALISVARECEKEGISVLVADSMTHVWREVCESALREINEQRAKKGRARIQKLEFQHWGAVKARWAEWTDLYLNSKLHIIICGRAGYEYDFQEVSGSEKKELVKTGVKMKTESEFGFEPSLLVEMERVFDGEGRMLHRATVLGDRFGIIDGKVCDNPGFEFFLPHINALTPTAHAPIDTSTRTELGLDEEGDADWNRERRQRTIFCEEIQALLLQHHPGQTAQEKKAKADLIRGVFNTGSWTKVESLSSQALKEGLSVLRAQLAPRGGNGPREPSEADLPIAEQDIPY